MNEILNVNSIVKKFGKSVAVDGVSFKAYSGRIFGLLGPNGAGKTTTIRMITNILMPDEGSITLYGERVSSKLQNRIGYLPEERGLYKKSKVIEQLVYFARLKGMDGKDALISSRRWLDKLGALNWQHKKIQELSKGMQQKVQFISTVTHDPDFLIFDEPFSGFDPVNRDTLKDVILELKDAGKTIILSTHVMEQVEQLCDDICLINNGRVVLEGKVSEIKSGFGRDTAVIEFDGDDSFINEMNGIKLINKSKGRVEFKLPKDMNNPSELLKIAADKVKIYKFDIQAPSLHEIFVETVSRKEE
ncbi:MAG: ABC transporter ATP-binding protein [Bacteroidota bacterium]